MSFLSRAMQRRTPVEQEAVPEPTLVRQGERAVCTVHGELRSVSLRPVDGVTALEAELHDGSDSVTLVWLGRRGITGVAPGRRLTVHGRIGRRGVERILYNPRYELHA